MKIAVLSPVAWRTPPSRYGPWEQMASNIAEGLIQKGVEVTLFATADSLTEGELQAIIPKGYEEDPEADPKVCECLHISNLMERAEEFDLIHNNFDFLPLTFSRLIDTPMVTTIHGFSSPKIIEVYERYNPFNHYVSISLADRNHRLRYRANVYNGVKVEDFNFNHKPQDYLLYFGRIHHDKGTFEAIQIANKTKMPLVISGYIQDKKYFEEKVAPWLNENITYVGNSPPRQRDRLLGGARALLHPINFDEPFGLSVAEAMLCGTPVIAFKRGAMEELIVHQKTGFLVKNVNEAVDAVADVDVIQRKNCRDWALLKFSQQSMVDSYQRVYKNILEENPDKKTKFSCTARES